MAAERQAPERQIRPVDGFDPLFRSHEQEVVRLCRRLLGDESGADAVQEVFLRARQGFEGYDPARPFRAWLLAVASHHCIDQLRRTAREVRLFEPRELDAGDLLGPGPTPLRHALAAERRELVQAAIDALPHKYRLPLLLRYFEELDYEAIAGILDVTPNQVGTLLFRARRRLRDRLAEDAP